MAISCLGQSDFSTAPKLELTKSGYSWTTRGVVQDALSWARFCLNSLKPSGDFSYFEEKLSKQFLMFSHKPQYWMSKTVEGGGLKWGGYAIEAFAEFSEVKMMHPDEYEKLKELFPNYTKEYEKAITEASKQYVMEQIRKEQETSS